MSDGLESRLLRLEDRNEINELFVAYGRYLDLGDVESFAGLFAADGELLLGPLGRARGREQIMTMMAGLVAGLVGSPYHVISSPVISLDGDTATAEVMWTVINAAPDGHPTLSAVGRHLDELIREDGRWRILRRRGVINLPAVTPTKF
jgi:uncharacterized protein (TIGR02246 family)